MSVLVIDVETIGARRPEHEAAIAEMAEARHVDPEAFAALCPPLARVVCVGMKAIDSGQERVYFDGSLFGGINGPMPGGAGHTALDGEAELLAAVNKIVMAYSRLVTFNGRVFDLPVLIHRMVINGVTPSTKLLNAAREYRYKPNIHIDLRDAMSFFGAAQIGPLRAVALGYGLVDPKANGNGKDVIRLVEAGDHEALCRYCAGDVRVEACLYKRWADAAGIA
jgi:hypothetical protein